MKYCANHPVKAATQVCKKCGKDICNQCVLQTDVGIFCSKECYEGVKAFQAQVEGIGVRRGPGIFAKLKAWAVQLIAAAVVLGGVAAVFYFVFDAKSPGAAWKLVKGWIGL